MKFDYCIVGAGVAGSSMAFSLAKKGKRIAIIDRSWEEQYRIVGELLQPGGVEQLNKIGLDDVLTKIDGHPVNGYRIYQKGEYISVNYPNKAEGIGFHNGKFVQELRNSLVECNNITRFTGNVTSLKESKGRVDGVNYIEGDIEYEIKADLTIVCDGANSLLRSNLHEAKKEVTSYFLGFEIQSTDLPMKGAGHLITGDHPPVLLYPISSTTTRCLIDFPGKKAPRMGDKLRQEIEDKFFDHIPKSFQNKFKEALLTEKFYMMPNHRLVAAPKLDINGVVMIGDSLNMRHPLTGGGMTVALNDVSLLSELLLQEVKIDTAIKKFYFKRKKQIGGINILADALYKVMVHPELQENTFHYLSKGGKKVNEPISLLSGQNKDIDLLEKHFIGVAKNGVWNRLIKKPSISSYKSTKTTITEALHILSPLLKDEDHVSKKDWVYKKYL
jgi:squalene monooxygenase